MSNITKVNARQVLNSQGNPTIEVDVYTRKGNLGRAIVPSGVSTGKYEALELLDNKERFWKGKSVGRAIDNVKHIIGPKIVGKSVTSQRTIDKIMRDLDGTKNKSHLGANAILGVSMAVAKAAAKDLKIPLWEYFAKLSKTTHIWLPIPMFNIVNGGEHSDNNLDFQEYMIFPNSAKDYSQALEWTYNVVNNLEEILKEKNYSTNRGKEGGFAPDFKSNEEPIELIIEAINKSNCTPGKDIIIALDIAASTFYNKRKKVYQLKCDNKNYTADELVDYYVELIHKYPIFSLEDPMSEEDPEGFRKICERVSKKIQIVGDDLFVTNKKLLRRYAKRNIANSIIIKMNQIGTITETLETIKLARNYNYQCIISHRSSETEDTTLADLAVGVNAGQVKTGALWGTERLSKYNRFIRIGEEIKDRH